MRAKLYSVIILGLAACAGPSEETKTPPPAAAAPAPAPEKKPEPPATTPDAEFRASKPPPMPEPLHFSAPVPERRQLKNGLEVLIVENHQVPLVSAELLIKTGMDGNPVAQPGLAEFTAAMMDEGTKTRSATQLAEQIEDLALRLSVRTDQDATRVHLNSPSEVLPQALELAADVALNPAFRPEDVERGRKRYLTDLAQRQQVPAAIASDAGNRVLYGPNHPWGQPQNGTLPSVSKLKPADLAKWHARWFVPSNAILSVSGDVKIDELMPLLEKNFGGWKAKKFAAAKATLPAETGGRRIAYVEHAGTQSVVVVPKRMLSATDPDLVPMRTGNYVLGGLFTSRLNLNLREDKAFSYGVRSAISTNDRTGVFWMQGNIVAQHTPEAIVEMEKEFNRFSSGEVAPDELKAAKNAYVRSLPSALETNDAVAGSMASLALDGLPLNYYAKLPEQVEKVSADDVARVAHKYIQPGSWPVVVVGPVNEWKDKLTELKLGPVEPLQLYGSEKPEAHARGR